MAIVIHQLASWKLFLNTKGCFIEWCAGITVQCPMKVEHSITVGGFGHRPQCHKPHVIDGIVLVHILGHHHFMDYGGQGGDGCLWEYSVSLPGMYSQLDVFAIE